MKKITVLFAVVALLSLSFNVTAQWQYSGSDIYFNGGNVGIGTDAPANTLSIVSQNNQCPLSIVSQSHPATYVNIDHYGNENGGSSTLEMRDLAHPGSRACISRLSDNHGYGGSLYMENYYEGTRHGVLVLSELGNVGIGNGNVRPYSKLQVDNGDIYIANINKGIIMKSPNGQCWRGVLDNDGQLAFSNIECPSASSTYTESNNFSNDIYIYPNPSKDIVYIKIKTNKVQNINAELYNISGKLVYMKSYKTNSANINLSELETGLYILKLLDENGSIIKTEKIIKK